MPDKPLNFVKRTSYLRITRDRVVRLRYAVLDAGSGEALAMKDDLYYLHGGYGGAFPRIEEALEGLVVDAEIDLTLGPEDCYGSIDPALHLQVPVSELPQQARHAGAQLDGEGEDGSVVKFRVLDVKDGVATVDGNHPLAGRELRFVLQVLDIRDASEAELQAGYAFAADVARGSAS